MFDFFITNGLKPMVIDSKKPFENEQFLGIELLSHFKDLHPESFWLFHRTFFGKQGYRDIRSD